MIQCSHLTSDAEILQHAHICPILRHEHQVGVVVASGVHGCVQTELGGIQRWQWREISLRHSFSLSMPLDYPVPIERQRILLMHLCSESQIIFRTIANSHTILRFGCLITSDLPATCLTTRVR